MSDQIKHVSDATFEQDVLQSSTPVLVDYWAEWCGPCKMFAPVLEDLARTHAGRLTIAKLDIDANPETTGKFGIRGIPTLVLMEGAKERDRVTGALNVNALRQWVEHRVPARPKTQPIK